MATTDEGIGAGASKGEPWKLQECPECNRIGKPEGGGLRCMNLDCSRYMGDLYAFPPGPVVLQICFECEDSGIEFREHKDDGAVINHYCDCPAGLAKKRAEHGQDLGHLGLLTDD